MLTKRCGTYKKDKSLSEFPRRSDRDQLLHHCRSCKNAYHREYSARNKEKVSNYRRSRKEEIKKWFNEEAKNKPCADCGNQFPACCMDFDHLEQGTKTKTLANLVGDGYSKERILKEIEKCDLVCSNCHRIRTRDRGWNQWTEENL